MSAKAEVYELLKSLVMQNIAIVLVSSKLPEMLNLCNRLYAMHRSRLVAELTGGDINGPAVLAHFFREGETPALASEGLGTLAGAR